ncbi:hypothetical protein MNBD_DELTA03-723 [hydrothermal vent metagenome]|uniref:Lcl C-terminal domain-containing protein n=1 Tax=hydrothermal vent metagenome TaxID=652676 RepID=A0A3B0VEF3_9ZZZZ
MAAARIFTVFFLAAALFLTGAQSVPASGTRLENLGNGTCQDRVTGRMWQITPSRQRFSSKEKARKYVKSLTTGGHHDWRLPTEDELTDLLGLIAIQGNDDCKFPRLDKVFWLVDSHRKTIPARLEMGCFCRGDFDLVQRHRGQVRGVRTITKTKRK